MPLSKHLYSLDEVQASLSYCCTRKNYKETLFWCKELIESGCASEAISVLFDTWLWQVGPVSISWLIHNWNHLASDEINEDFILLAAFQLSSLSKYDNSLWNILILRLKQNNQPPDCVTFKSPSILPSTNPKEQYFIRSIFQGKAQNAWWISSYLDNIRVWDLLTWYNQNICKTLQKEYSICLNALKQYEKLLGYHSEEYDIAIRCMAILIFCHKNVITDNLVSSIPSTYLNSTIEERLYSIPITCLYSTTLRGIYKWSQQNIIQLHNIEKYMIGCPFWDEALSEYSIINENGIIQWNSDYHMEAFYDKYFPKGIPDEWSNEEKYKSHGNGVLGPMEEITLIKFCSKFLSKPSRLAWNTSDVISFLKITPYHETFYHSILHLYFKQKWILDDEFMSLLEPVRKIKRIDMNSLSTSLTSVERGRT